MRLFSLDFVRITCAIFLWRRGHAESVHLPFDLRHLREPQGRPFALFACAQVQAQQPLCYSLNAGKPASSTLPGPRSGTDGF